MFACESLKKPLFHAPSSLPSALPQTVAVFRAFLKLGVVVGGWVGGVGKGGGDPFPSQFLAVSVSMKLLLSRDSTIERVQCCPSHKQTDR